MSEREQPRSKSEKKTRDQHAASASAESASIETPSSKQPRKKAESKTASQPRVCRYLFILGSGVDPGEQAEILKAEFQKTPDLDFTQAQQHVVGIARWKSGDKESLRDSVIGFLNAWFAARQEPFDEKRLLIRDYQDDKHRFAVAGYFPRVAAATDTPHAAAAPKASPATGTNEPSDINDAKAVAGGHDSDVMFAEATPQKPAGALQKVIDRLKSQPPKRLGIIASGIVVVILAVVFLPGMFSTDSTGGGKTNVAGTNGADEGSDSDDAKAAALPPPQFETGLVRVYTSEAGFKVLIDGQPVKDGDGEIVTTPCAITTKRGTRTVTVYREGFLDASREVTVEDDSEIELEVTQDRAGVGSVVLIAPHFGVPVGKPIPLKNINSLRPEFDPYVTPDQLSIWFVGDRLEGRGIYVATRQSALHDFDEPRLVSRSSDLPGSPSVTDDALYVVYAVPEKARLMAITRSNPLAEFSEKQSIRHSSSLAPTWPSAQMLGDGTRIYWVEIGSTETLTLVASRADERRDFGEMLKVTMPGTHPCLTNDGLRQFTYDGKQITRYRRLNPKKQFNVGEVIADLELANYTASKKHRQFFVTADEQWMFYCDDPVASGDLFMVRIAEQPGWGVVAKGKSISAKPIVVAQVPDMPDPDKPDKKTPDKPVDPRSLPLAYTSHWNIFSALITGRQYSELEGLIRIAKANPAMKQFEEQLKWDEEELNHIQQFWKDVDAAAAEMKKGDQLRIGSFQVEFQEFKDGELSTRRGVTPIRRQLTELSTTDLLALYDRKFAADDSEAQYRAAIFLAYDKDTLERSVASRMEKAGDLSQKYNERQVRRALVQAVAELDRTNFSQGVAFLNDVKARSKGTPIEQEVIALEQKLYTYVKWAPRGPRKWQQDDTAYAASADTSRGSLMVSELQYKNFELSLEWKVENVITAQGGVYFRYAGQGNLVETALKIHLANDSGVNPDPYATGSLFALVAPNNNAAKPAGEWNTTLIRHVDKKLTVTINGKKVLDAPAENADAPNIPDKGFVALDGEAGGITYRKLLLSELP